MYVCTCIYCICAHVKMYRYVQYVCSMCIMYQYVCNVMCTCVCMSCMSCMYVCINIKWILIYIHVPCNVPVPSVVMYMDYVWHTLYVYICVHILHSCAHVWHSCMCVHSNVYTFIHSTYIHVYMYTYLFMYVCMCVWYMNVCMCHVHVYQKCMHVMYYMYRYCMYTQLHEYNYICFEHCPIWEGQKGNILESTTPLRRFCRLNRVLHSFLRKVAQKMRGQAPHLLSLLSWQSVKYSN